MKDGEMRDSKGRKIILSNKKVISSVNPKTNERDEKVATCVEDSSHKYTERYV